MDSPAETAIRALIAAWPSLGSLDDIRSDFGDGETLDDVALTSLFAIAGREVAEAWAADGQEPSGVVAAVIEIVQAAPRETAATIVWAFVDPLLDDGDLKSIMSDSSRTSLQEVQRRFR